MIILTGKAVFGGITRGKLLFYHRDENIVSKTIVDNTEIEMQRYEYARSCALKELEELYQTAVSDVGERDAGIFIIHQMLIKDEEFDKTIRRHILSDRYSADYAVAKTARDYSHTLGEMGSEYIKERAADIKDISDRLIRHIQNKSQNRFEMSEKAIVCADDLVPSETVQLDRSKVQAFVTCYGSSNSHTAILARTMNIPAIIGVGKELLESYSGRDALIDGYGGAVYIDPDEDTCRAMERKQEEEGKKRELLKRLKGRKNITLDGTKIRLYANISGLDDVEQALENDADGIGLFRSEFLYLQDQRLPDEEFQFYTYRRVLEGMKGKKVIIRTLDIGADKNIKYFGLAKEENPALGMRSIRLCLTRPELFRTQLRALLRASVYGELSIMLPMITDISEIIRTRELIEETKAQLRARCQPYCENIELGIMIETPAAALLSDILAPEVDFFSIGTNDLEQYVLATDRQNLQLENYRRDLGHEALLRMMRIACENAKKHGIWVGMCGELGADLSLTEEFLRMGISEISVTPAQILPLKQKIRSMNLKEIK